MFLFAQCFDEFIGFWRQLWVIHYDNQNQEFTRLSIIKKKKKGGLNMYLGRS
jgi:hypothetical protein